MAIDRKLRAELLRLLKEDAESEAEESAGVFDYVDWNEIIAVLGFSAGGPVLNHLIKSGKIDAAKDAIKDAVKKFF